MSLKALIAMILVIGLSICAVFMVAEVVRKAASYQEQVRE